MSLVDAEASRNRNLSLLEEGRRLVALAEDAGILLRLIGGTAVLAHCPQLLEREKMRPIGDIDAVVEPRKARHLAGAVQSGGYEEERRFNALHGDKRMIFRGPLSQVDVMVGTFEMCHRIDLTHRLDLDHPTVTVSDLLLTKLQIVELNEKDAKDVLHLIEEHELAGDDGDVVNVQRIANALAGDWGLWRTVTGNLEWLRDHVSGHHIVERLHLLRSAIDEHPKSVRWKLRARVGERVRWYIVPEDV